MQTKYTLKQLKTLANYALGLEPNQPALIKGEGDRGAAILTFIKLIEFRELELPEQPRDSKGRFTKNG